MKHAFRLLGLVVCMVGLSWTQVSADWMPGDAHKMHYPQLPDENGWDVNATYPKVLADDWECSESGLVTDIHFWGSWQGGLEGTILGFNLSIHSNIPGPPSMPGTLLWDFYAYDYTVVQLTSPAGQGWYDPNTGQYVHPDHYTYYQYNIYIDPDEAYFQEKGTIYWLDISASVLEPDRYWGWKTSQDHWMDDAVWGDLPNPAWQELYEPPAFTQSLDLAFVITPEPATIGLIGLGLAGVFAARRKKG